MSPRLEVEQTVRDGFPRVSGDEPEDVPRLPGRLAFSPRERG